MDKHKLIKMMKISAFGIIVLSLLILVCNISYGLFSNSFSDCVKFDKSTTEYLSFNYAENGSYIFKNDELKIINDDRGKRLSKKDYFDFSVSASEKFVDKETIEYDVVAILMGDFSNGKYLKFYMTDQNNNELDGYKGHVPSFFAFPNYVMGKVVYSGMISKDNLYDDYRIRVWIDDGFKKLNINKKMNLRILIKLKND